MKIIRTPEDIPQGPLSLHRPVRRARGMEGDWVSADQLAISLAQGRGPDLIWYRDSDNQWQEARVARDAVADPETPGHTASTEDSPPIPLSLTEEQHQRLSQLETQVRLLSDQMKRIESHLQALSQPEP